MSSKYQQPFVIPEGFPELIKGFTREILRTQPDNIYEFGARYFEELLSAGGSHSKQAPTPGEQDQARGIETEQHADGVAEHIQQAAHTLDIAHTSLSELEPLIMQLFLEADKDESGYLDRQEFTQVLRAGNLKLSDRQIRQILAEADENDDNVIQYKEFLPVMVDILQSIKAIEQARQQRGDAEDEVREEVQLMLLHGMAQDELERLMLKVFQKADTDGSGQLSRKEFKKALRAADLGLTRKDINILMSSVDVNNDGQISYQEFVPLCFQVLVERFKDEIIMTEILKQGDGVQGMLLEGFQAVDADQLGTLTQQQVKAVLQDLSFKTLGLSTLQLVALLSEAPLTPDGKVQYLQFVPIAASMIASMYDVDKMRMRVQAINEVSAAGGIQALSSLNTENLRAALGEAFQQADSEGTGQLQLPQVMDILSQLGTLTNAEQLSEAHMQALFAVIDTDDSKTVDWAELVNFVCDAIEHLERERFIAQYQLAPAPQADEPQADEPQAEAEAAPEELGEAAE